MHGMILIDPLSPPLFADEDEDHKGRRKGLTKADMSNGAGKAKLLSHKKKVSYSAETVGGGGAGNDDGEGYYHAGFDDADEFADGDGGGVGGVGGYGSVRGHAQQAGVHGGLGGSKNGFGRDHHRQSSRARRQGRSSRRFGGLDKEEDGDLRHSSSVATLNEEEPELQGSQDRVYRGGKTSLSVY